MIAGLTSALLLAYCVWLVHTDAPSYRFFIRLYVDKHFLKQTLRDLGVLGPILFMLLQALQVIISPIPGEATGFLGGYLFGGELKRRFLVTALQRNRNAQLRLRALQEIAPSLDDIALVPGAVTVNPNEVDITWELCGRRFDLPILAAAMDGVVGPSLATEMGRLGGLGRLRARVTDHLRRAAGPAAQLGPRAGRGAGRRVCRSHADQDDLHRVRRRP